MLAEKETAMNTKNQEVKPSCDIKIHKAKSNRGRKAESCNVRIEPIFREEPDIEKLGRALIAMAVHAVNVEMEEKRKAQET